MSIPNKVEYILESRFNERLSRLQNLISSTKEKREKILTDKELRAYYTNTSICQRHYNINGENSPPLLLRQYNIRTDKDRSSLLEAQNNIQLEYTKDSSSLCIFTEEEIKYIIDSHHTYLSEGGIDSFPILCDIKGATHVLKHVGESLSDIEGFFMTRFIMEDNIIPLFDTRVSFSDSARHKTVFIKTTRY